MNESQNNELLEIQKAKLEIQKQLLQMQQEQRTFTILQMERTLSEEDRKATSSIIAASCILGAAVALYFDGLNPNGVIQHELGAIYSWELLGQYFQDLGLMVTLLSAAAGGFVAKALKHNKKCKDVQHQFEDMNASLQNNNSQNMEVENDVKTR